MGIHRAGDVRSEILMLSPGRVGQLETAVDGDPSRIGQVAGQFAGADKSRERQLNPLTARLTQE